jgi:hypothetical protein
MSERTAVVLVGSAGVLLSTGACGAVMALGGNNELAVAALLVVFALGVDQLSKLIMSYGEKDGS